MTLDLLGMLIVQKVRCFAILLGTNTTVCTFLPVPVSMLPSFTLACIVVSYNHILSTLVIFLIQYEYLI